MKYKLESKQEKIARRLKAKRQGILQARFQDMLLVQEKFMEAPMLLTTNSLRDRI